MTPSRPAFGRRCLRPRPRKPTGSRYLGVGREGEDRTMKEDSMNHVRHPVRMEASHRHRTQATDAYHHTSISITG